MISTFAHKGNENALEARMLPYFFIHLLCLRSQQTTKGLSALTFYNLSPLIRFYMNA